MSHNRSKTSCLAHAKPKWPVSERPANLLVFFNFSTATKLVSQGISSVFSNLQFKRHTYLNILAPIASIVEFGSFKKNDSYSWMVWFLPNLRVRSYLLWLNDHLWSIRQGTRTFCLHFEDMPDKTWRLFLSPLPSTSQYWIDLVGKSGRP